MRSAYVFLIGLVLASCSQEDTQTRTPEQIREDLRRAELHSPSMYLSVTGELQNDTVTCTVSNTAKEADFTKVTVAVNYFDDARKLMKSDLLTLTETVENGASVTHKQGVTPPEGHASVTFAVREAK